MKKLLLQLSALFLLMISTGTLDSKAEDTVWYGYYDGTEPLSEFGTGIKEDYDCAAWFSGETGGASGKTILAVRFAIQGAEMAESLKVWLSSSLPSDCDDADFGCYQIPAESIKEGSMVEFNLPSPLAVPKSGIYVGYSFGTTDPFPILTTQAQTTQEGGFHIRTSKSYRDWKNFAQYRYGNLALQVKLDGSILENAASISSLPEMAGLTDSSVIIPMEITSHGISEILSIDFTVTSSDGSSSEHRHIFKTPIKTINETGIIPLEFTCGQTAGIDYKTVCIKKVNGKENEWTVDTERRGAVVTLESSMERSTVMEEFTGTWCGWCPRGAVGIQALTKDFGSEFIGIAIHRNDPMEIPEYAPILDKVGGFPSCTLNRSVSGDPFFGTVTGPGVEESYGIYKDVVAQQSELVAAKAGIYSEWSDEASLKLRVSAECTLGYDRDTDPPYRLMYVVLADSLKGESATWFQSNDFHLTMAESYKDDPYLGWLTEKGSVIRDYVYNDVAIAAAGVVGGIRIQTEGVWKRNEPKECGSIEFDLSANELVQNKANIKVAAVILDEASGRIVNAVCAPVGTNAVSEVKAIETKRLHTGRDMIFDISGSRIPSLRKGINIIKHSDGTIEKTFIK